MLKRKKDKKKDNLDTETTFVNMNVEGFRWYRPEKNGEEAPKLTKEESRAVICAAYEALLPLMLGIAAAMLLLAGLAYLWLS